jgi:phage host-nuclease inhibitor protein Gam
MSTVGREASVSTGSAVSHTAVSENVAVKSVVSTETQSKVSMENTQKMAALMSKLGTTHQQIDEYSRRRTEQISEEVSVAIGKIVADTQSQQANLLADANVRSASIEEEYKVKLQQYVEELDTAKAQNLAVLEKDLNLRQELILEQARKRIDDLNEEANRLKMGVLRDAQAQANAKVDAITQQVAALGAEDANRLLTSSSTTIIRTEAKSSGETHVAGTTAVLGTTATTVEKSSTAHSSSSTTATKH